ncbi:DUF4013 domain-containing protein [Candidatus Woesearchaeota archaeon]|nr:DUF4013 domain-containing protein [Candidatus Woesearchaeota archaeon]
MTKQTEDFGESLKQGLKYPWNKASRLWNILWLIVPIFGWFALIGYGKKIIRELISGKRKKIPMFGNPWVNFKQGVIVIVMFIPTMIALGIINMIPVVGGTLYMLISIFILPWLTMNFFIEETFSSLWDVRKAFDIVFGNAMEYIIAYLKTLIYSVIYGLLSIVLIGIPCYTFGYFYFLTEFYSTYKK